MKRISGPPDRTEWDRHGYLFFALFGAVFVGMGFFGAWLLNIPADKPLREVIDTGEFFLFLLAISLCVVLSYYIALFISDWLNSFWWKLMKMRR